MAAYGSQNYGGESGSPDTAFVDQDNMGAFSAKSVRLAFIRKVYGILSA